ncbi:hypothetical protein B2I21_07080 [Chryseobacterium mucoviscidosis]|nr:hypothetical protein B2I21_07080 [Chryseobacterium mucoviscidosis]
MFSFLWIWFRYKLTNKEHSYGVKINTVDNPGWSVEINLTDTCLEDVPFETIEEERNEEDWFYCIVRDGVFHGAGGATNLEEILYKLN